MPLNMKRIVLALSALVAITATSGEPGPPQLATNTVANATNWFAVTGMSCKGCAQGIAGELKRTPGVAFASVSFSNKVATVAYDTNRISTKELRKVIVEAGYEAKLAKP
jgi:P-type Cu+ transporter